MAKFWQERDIFPSRPAWVTAPIIFFVVCENDCSGILQPGCSLDDVFAMRHMGFHDFELALTQAARFE